jgi:DNA-binding NarL/FixJ family response regulator
VNTVQVLIVDDSEDFALAARAFLAGLSDIEVVGHAWNGLEAVEMVNRLHPALVLMDLNMPHMDGIQATQKIKTFADAPKVVIVSMHDPENYGGRADLAGADGFVSKARFVVNLPPLIQSLFGPPGAIH